MDKIAISLCTIKAQKQSAGRFHEKIKKKVKKKSLFFSSSTIRKCFLNTI